MPQHEAIPHRVDEDTFDIRSSVRRLVASCRNHRLLIFATCAASVIAVIAYMMIWPPVYSATVIVYAEGKDDATRDDFYRPWNVFRKDDLRTEAALLTTTPILEVVVDKLDLSYDDVYHPFTGYTIHLWKNSVPGRFYRGLKRSIFPPKTSPYAPSEADVARGVILADFKKGIRLEAVADANVGHLEVRGPTPEVGLIANTLVDAFGDARRQRHAEEATEAEASLQEEVNRARKELAGAEAALEEYSRQNGLVLAFEKDKAEVVRWFDVRAGVLELQSQLAGLEKDFQQVSSTLQGDAGVDSASTVFQQSLLLDQMRTLKLQLGVQLQSALLKYRPEAPEVLDLKRRLEAIETTMKTQAEDFSRTDKETPYRSYEELRQQQVALKAQIDAVRANLAIKQQAANDLEAHLLTIPDKLAAYHDLSRSQQAVEKKYVVLSEKLMAAQISRATALSSPPAIRVAEYAKPPSNPVWPKRNVLIPLALIGGLLAGVVLSISRDALSGTVTRERLLERRELPVYATIDLGNPEVRALSAGNLLLTNGRGRDATVAASPRERESAGGPGRAES